jgi:hypothetical protein
MIDIAKILLLGLWGVLFFFVTCSPRGIAATGSSKAREGLPMIDKESLAKRLDSLDSHSATMVRAPQSKLEQIPTPFFQRGSIYLVNYRIPTRPVVFSVGYAESGFTALLAANPEGYFNLAEKAGLQLDNSERRIAYLRTFLETTRSFGERFQLLNDVKEIHPRPNLSEVDLQRFRELSDKYKSIIRPPVISDQPPWESVIFAIRRQNLVRIVLKLTNNGRVQMNETIIDKEIPIPYSL